MAIFPMFANLTSVPSVFFGELKEPLDALLVIVVFRTLHNYLEEINY